MTPDPFRHARIFCAAVFFVALAACGGGGGGGNDNTDNPPGTPAPVSGNCMGTGEVVISGVIEYEFVPAVADGSGAQLDYASSSFRPVRQAEVEASCPGEADTYATTVTDDNGAYMLTVPENVDVVVRVRASMSKDGNPGWDVRVVDNTREQGVWAAEGEAFNSETGSVTVNLRADSGWDGATYATSRTAAPFAILDAVYTGMQKVLTANPGATFPALKLNWSPENNACMGTRYPYADGCIGTSFFANFGGSAGRNIFILGDADTDTDEYDRHVILHEWAHYYENAFSRSDSIGGRHSGGDALDPRVAFGEGWGNAFSGIATDDPAYVDTMGTDQSSGFSINVEAEPVAQPGWWNESSVQQIVYDLYDDTPSEDNVALGFAPIHAVLSTSQKTTAAKTSIFPFIYHLRESNTMEAVAIDDLVARQNIATVTDIWGEGRSADDDGSDFSLLGGGAEYVVPIHTSIDITDGVPINICTTNQLVETSSEHNRLGTRRFLRFVAPGGTWEISLGESELTNSDPDFNVTLNGDLVVLGDERAGPETEPVTLAAGQTYVIEVYDWLNVDEMDEGGNTGGRACFDLTFTET